MSKITDSIKNIFSPLQNMYQKRPKTVMLIILAILILFPIVYQDNYYKSIIVRILFYVILASSLNIINGYSGQFNLGHAGFMCIGAYTAGLLATKLGTNFWINIVASGCLAAFIGFLVSLPTLKLSGIYLSIVTLGFSEIVRLIALNWASVTNGPLGVKNIPSPTLFGISLGSTNAFYYLTLFFVIISLFIMYRILNSRIGRAWIAIREDSMAARSLGVEIKKYKSLNFVTGAFFAGVGGCIMAYFYRYISSDMFILDEGFNVISMVVIGGQGTMIGPVIGAVIVNVLYELFRVAEQFRMVFYAILIIFMMWWRPQGLAGASDSILAGNNAEKKLKKKASDDESKKAVEK